MPRRSAALAVHAATLVAFLAASSAPTPLYRLYQAQWRFSPVMLTVIFAVYALALLAALIVAGRLSDHLGRRRVIGLALALEIGAMAIFLAAQGPGWLILARLLQGGATGMATAALGAALIDVDPDHGALINGLAPMIGMGVGALGATALAELAPAPLRLVFLLLLAVFALQFLRTRRTPETGPHGARPGALRSLWPRISVPRAARGALLATAPINVAIWALGGFYLSLMPSLIGRVTGTSSVWLGGLSVTALTLSGGVAALFARRSRAKTALLAGTALLLLGVLAILAGANLGRGALLLAGSVVAGAGFGAGFLGVVRRVLPLAAPGERAGLTAAFYVESYLANSLPAILAGYLARGRDLLEVANGYGTVLIALVLVGLVATEDGKRFFFREKRSKKASSVGSR